MPMPLNHVYLEIDPWACEADCGYFCQIITVEVGVPYLRLTLRCPACGGKASRYWDTANHGWVEAMGVKSETSQNEHDFVNSRPCKYALDGCPHKEVKRFFRRGVELEECIDQLAATAAMKCPNMTEHELQHCSHTLFDLNSQGSLFRLYQNAYRNCDAAAEVPKACDDGS
jgi:hypothetical protein